MSGTAAALVPMADHIKQFWRYLERERVRILVDLHRDGYCDSSSFNDEFAKALLAERTAAQQKIAELEAAVWGLRIFAKAQGVIAERERQRRENAEAILHKMRVMSYPLAIEADAHLSRYPTASDSEERGG